MLERIGKIYQEQGGIGGVFWRLYSYGYKNLLRPRLPAIGTVLYSEVVVGHRRLGDTLFLPTVWRAPKIEDMPDYEATLVKALRAHVRPGASVVVVGCASGVTCALAAKLSGTTVVCFEGDRDGVLSTLETARLNGVTDEIDVRHAIVAKDISVYGNPMLRAETIVSPSDLPRCDVLELDCEGAELQILSEMKIRPRVVIVETHGIYGSPTEMVQRILQSRGYVVENLGIAEPRYAKDCIEGGIDVLVGKFAD
ncbi:FkbM family methyltransferase [Bradyrhizobium sp. SSUT112]|uniref:FkbM family methyltransferase n=1 Tax=Bradyrhizobium sp. SSUT112 TaxID=3040604 RepID=UPI00244A4998|nr:FkbM family methyltransferase [Bradyrhizobium sp. SSUT112]MDH2357114.1 FkbM family methyltransferase [Bradyrhizobium sp. SSUT112]